MTTITFHYCGEFVLKFHKVGWRLEEEVPEQKRKTKRCVGKVFFDGFNIRLYERLNNAFIKFDVFNIRIRVELHRFTIVIPLI